MKHKPNIKPKRIREANKPYLALKYQEKAYIYKWVKTQNKTYLKKYENVPELLLLNYETELSEKEIKFNRPFTSPERLYVLKERVYWHLHLEPEWLRFLKVTGMNATEFGLMFGYYSGSSFYNSSGRLKQIKGAIALLERFFERWQLIMK